MDARLKQARAQGPALVSVVRAVRDLCLRGGKRLRGGLAVAGQIAAGPVREPSSALELGVALELLQAYLLIHDDWMDGDTVRRGGPSVHAQLGNEFGSTHLGDRAGVLAGDYAAALSLEVLGRLPVDPPRLVRMVQCYATMQLDVVAGQQLDLVSDGLNVEQTYALKTASYTVRGPLELGALLAGAGPEVLAALERYALPLGIAFQLRDDLIGAFGNAREAGKPVGSDLRAGKRTVLLELGGKKARGRDRQLLEHVVGRADATEDEVRGALDILERTGAREAVERRIGQLTRRAEAALRHRLVTSEGRELLLGALASLTQRSA